MKTDNKDCSGCKWFEETVSWGMVCLSKRSILLNADDCRSNPLECGPEARYYEPKEDQK